MATGAELRERIHAWAVLVSGLDVDHVIWGADNGPAPDTPYVALDMMTEPQSTFDNLAIERPNNDGDSELFFVWSTAPFTLDIECIGDGADDIARQSGGWTIT